MKKPNLLDNRKSCLYVKEIKFLKSQIYKHQINSATNSSALDTAANGASQMTEDNFKMVSSQLEI